MSLSIAGRIAYSALSAAQVQIAVTSANIANASTDGYTVKSATQVSTVSNGVGTGTAITAIDSDVDAHVFAALVDADSDLAAATTTASYTDTLQSLLGSTTGSDDGGTSIAASLSSLETTLSALASAPDSDSAKAAVIDALDDGADGLRSLSSSIQSLRADADDEIATAVETINDSLAEIDDLNDAIVAAGARGQSTADLEDQRNTALRAIAALIDVDTTTTAAGVMHVYTTSGTTLLDSAVHALGHDTVGTVSATTNFDAITVDGKDISSEIKSGSVDALLTLRDDTLVDAQDELDSLASALITTLNAITADGSAVPASAELTGTAAVAATDGLSGTGSVRIAVVDADGALVSSTDLDLSAYDTIGDLVDALDGLGGIDAAIGSDGHLTITSTASDVGVAIGALDSAVGDAGASFSARFGFNAVLTGSSAADIRVASGLLDDSSLLASGSLADDATLSTGATVLTAGSTAIADALYAAMTSEADYASSGGLGAQGATFVDYAAAIVADIADTAADAESDLVSQETIQGSLADTSSSATGVNLDEETAKLSTYQTLYSAAAQVMKTVEEMFSTLLDVVQAAS